MVVAAWAARNGSDFEIVSAVSTDGGSSWGVPQAIHDDNEVPDLSPVVTASAADPPTWLIVWQSTLKLPPSNAGDTDFDLLAVKAAAGDASAWGEPFTFNGNAATDGSGADSGLTMAWASKCGLVAVWSTTAASVNGTATGSDADLVYQFSTDQGATWSATAPVLAGSAAGEDGSSSDTSPSLALATNATWVLAWVTDNSLGDTIGPDTDVVFSTGDRLVTAVCGDGVVSCDEDCEPGLSDGCCTGACGFELVDAVCRPAVNACDLAEACLGSSADCPADLWSSDPLCASPKTLPPVLHAPATNESLVGSSGFNVTFWLGEVPSAGSVNVTLGLDPGSAVGDPFAPHVIHLAAISAAGNYTLVANPAVLSDSVVVSAASPSNGVAVGGVSSAPNDGLMDGASYTLVVSYVNDIGALPGTAPDPPYLVAYDGRTLAPTLAAPLPFSHVQRVFDVNYTLGEPPAPGSVYVVLDEVATSLDPGAPHWVGPLDSGLPPNGTVTTAPNASAPLAWTTSLDGLAVGIRDGLSYTATVTYADELRNAEAVAAPAHVFTYDVSPPNAVLASNAPDPTKTGVAMSVTWSEVVSGFDATAIATSSGTVSGLSTGTAFFTWTVVGADDGLLTVQISAGAVYDLAGNANAASNAVTRLIDTTTLPVVVTTPDNLGQMGAAGRVEFSLGEAAGSGGVTLTLTEAGAGAGPGSGADSNDPHVVVLAPPAFVGSAGLNGVDLDTADLGLVHDASYDLTVSYSDALGNPAASATAASVRFDGEPPSVVTLFTDAVSPVDAPMTVTLLWDEAVPAYAPIDGSGLALSCGTVVNATGGPQGFSFVWTDVCEGDVTLTVGPGVAVDPAGNTNTDSATLFRTYDSMTIPPVMAAPANQSWANASLAVAYALVEDMLAGSVVLVAAEAGTALDPADPHQLVLTGESAGNHGGLAVDTAALGLVDGATYKLRVGASDLLGHAQALSSPPVWVHVDRSPPVAWVAVVGGGGAVVPQVPFDVRVEWDEAVSGYDGLADLVWAAGQCAGGGGGGGGVSVTAAPLNVTGPVLYDVRILAIPDGEFCVRVSSGVARDGAYNTDMAGASLDVVVDTLTTAPVVVSPSGATLGPNLGLTFELAEAAQDGTLVVRLREAGGGGGGVLYTNNSFGSAFNAAGAHSVAIDLAPLGLAEGSTYVVEVEMADTLGHPSATGTTSDLTYDATPPDLDAYALSASPFNAAFQITMQWDEAVAVDPTVVVVTNGNLTGAVVIAGVAGPLSAARLTVAGVAEGDVVVLLPPGVVADLAGNAYPLAWSTTATFDQTPPELALTCSASNPTAATALTVSGHWSEAVPGFDPAVDVGHTAGTLAVVSSNDTDFEVVVGGLADGLVTVTVVGAADRAGNVLLGAAVLSRTIDTTTAPLLVTRPEAYARSNAGLSLAVVLSEATSAAGVSVVLTETATAGAGSAAGSSNATTVSPVGSTDLDPHDPHTLVIAGPLAAGVHSTERSAADLNGDGLATVTDLLVESVAYDVVISYADALGNPPYAISVPGFVFDTSPPVASMETRTNNVRESAAEFLVIWSESVTGFDATDLLISNGGVAVNWAGGPVVFSFRVASATTNVVTIELAAGAASDLAGNTNTGALSYLADVSEAGDTSVVEDPTTTTREPGTVSRDGVFLDAFDPSTAVFWVVWGMVLLVLAGLAAFYFFHRRGEQSRKTSEAVVPFEDLTDARRSGGRSSGRPDLGGGRAGVSDSVDSCSDANNGNGGNGGNGGSREAPLPPLPESTLPVVVLPGTVPGSDDGGPAPLPQIGALPGRHRRRASVVTRSERKRYSRAKRRAGLEHEREKNWIIGEYDRVAQALDGMVGASVQSQRELIQARKRARSAARLNASSGADLSDRERAGVPTVDIGGGGGGDGFANDDDDDAPTSPVLQRLTAMGGVDKAKLANLMGATKQAMAAAKQRHSAESSSAHGIPLRGESDLGTSVSSDGDGTWSEGESGHGSRSSSSSAAAPVTALVTGFGRGGR